jgi:hypothetical protein
VRSATSTSRCSARPARPAASTSRRVGSSRWTAVWEYGEWETDAGEKRHDYSVVGNVEFLTAPKPAGEPAPVKPSRNGRKAVAA